MTEVTQVILSGFEKINVLNTQGAFHAAELYGRESNCKAK